MKLTLFLRKLSLESVRIRLKNGTIVEGTVLGVDGLMNVHLKNVKITPPGKKNAPSTMDHLTVRGNTLLTIDLPSTLPVDTLLAESSNPEEKIKKSGRGRGARQIKM